MFDDHLIRYITDFLNSCNNCEVYDIFNRNNMCCVCKKIYCNKCIRKLHLHVCYLDRETMAYYCDSCNEQ